MKYTWECPSKDGTGSPLRLSADLNDLYAGELHCHLIPDLFNPAGEPPIYECRAGFVDPETKTHLLYRRVGARDGCREVLEDGQNILEGNCRQRNLYNVYLEKTGRQPLPPGGVPKKKPKKVVQPEAPPVTVPEEKPKVSEEVVAPKAEEQTSVVQPPVPQEEKPSVSEEIAAPKAEEEINDIQTPDEHKNPPLPPPPPSSYTSSEVPDPAPEESSSGFAVGGGFGLMLYIGYKLVQAARKSFAGKEEPIPARRNHRGLKTAVVHGGAGRQRRP